MDVREEGRVLNELVHDIASQKRDREGVIAIVNGLVASYILALNRALGSSGAALTQLMIHELGDLLAAYVDSRLGEVSYSETDLGELLVRAFKTLGIAEDVRLEKRSEHEWIVRVCRSIFTPAHELLRSRGIRESHLLPEALVAASIVRRMLRERGDANARVTVAGRLIEHAKDGCDVEIVIKQISSMASRSVAGR